MAASDRSAPRRLTLCRIATLALLAVSLVAGHAAADEPKPPAADTNPSRYPPPSAKPSLILTGALVTAGWYGGAVGISYLWSDSDGSKSLRIPVAGPYMALARTGCSDKEFSCGTVTLVVRTIFTAISAVGQTGGVLAMVEGIFLPTRPASELPPRPPPPRLKRAGVQVAPVLTGGDGLSLGVAGQF